MPGHDATVHFLRQVSIKVGGGLVTLWGVLTIIFFVAHLSGDPVKQLVPPNATPAEFAAASKFLGLSRPLAAQYGTYIVNAAHGDFGQSYYWQRPALPLVLSHVPATLLLVAVSVVGAATLSFTAAFVGAIRRGQIVDRLLTGIAAVTTAVPSFWLGALLLIVFSVDIRIFPVAGMNGVRSIVLPAITLGFFQVGVYFQIIRSASVEVLESDFIKLVMAKGVSVGRVVWSHVLVNVALTALTIVGLAFAATLGGTVIVEVIFGWPGIGSLLIQAANEQDFPVLESCVLVIGIGFILVNTVVDALYGVLNPQTAAALRGRARLSAVQRAA
jgi:peptide/nickel transport system permease protein